MVASIYTPGTIPPYLSSTGNPWGTDLGNVYGQAYSQAGQRSSDILGGYQQRYSDVMSDLEGMGAQSAKDIRSQYASAESAGMQGLVSRGLGGTTVLPSMRMGYKRQQTDALARLDETLRRERLGYRSSMSKDALDYLASQQNRQPTLQDIAQLQASQQAQQRAQAELALRKEAQTGQLGIQQQQLAFERERLAAEQQMTMQRQTYGNAYGSINNPVSSVWGRI